VGVCRGCGGCGVGEKRREWCGVGRELGIVERVFLEGPTVKGAIRGRKKKAYPHIRTPQTWGRLGTGNCTPGEVVLVEEPITPCNCRGKIDSGVKEPLHGVERVIHTERGGTFFI